MDYNSIPYSETALYTELGKRIELIQDDPTLAGKLDLPIEPPEGIVDELSELGKRVFRRNLRQLHRLLCGDNPDESQDRQKFQQALGVDDVIVPTIVSLLTSYLGLAPALASIIAILLLKYFLKPTYEETCSFWLEHLE